MGKTAALPGKSFQVQLNSSMPLKILEFKKNRAGTKRNSSLHGTLYIFFRAVIIEFVSSYKII